MATFDVVPMIDEINDELFTTRYSEGPIEQPAIGFSLNGFETQNYTKNTGSLYIFVILIVVTNCFFKIMRYLAFNYYFVRFYQKYRMNENLNEVLMKLVMNAYVEMMMSSLITLELITKCDIIYTSFNDAFGFTFAVIFFIYISILPLFI